MAIDHAVFASVDERIKQMLCYTAIMIIITIYLLNIQEILVLKSEKCVVLKNTFVTDLYVS